MRPPLPKSSDLVGKGILNTVWQTVEKVSVKCETRPLCISGRRESAVYTQSAISRPRILSRFFLGTPFCGVNAGLCHKKVFQQPANNTTVTHKPVCIQIISFFITAPPAGNSASPTDSIILFSGYTLYNPDQINYDLVSA